MRGRYTFQLSADRSPGRRSIGFNLPFDISRLAIRRKPKVQIKHLNNPCCADPIHQTSTAESARKMSVTARLAQRQGDAPYNP
jgi:hypothetical protein